jgi:hypothetical protein
MSLCTQYETPDIDQVAMVYVRGSKHKINCPHNSYFCLRVVSTLIILHIFIFSLALEPASVFLFCKMLNAELLTARTLEYCILRRLPTARTTETKTWDLAEIKQCTQVMRSWIQMRNVYNQPPSITPPSLSDHDSLWIEFPYCTAFRFTATFDIRPPRHTSTNCGEQTVALCRGFAIFLTF